MRGTRASAVAAVMAVGFAAAASGLGLPYRVADLDQGASRDYREVGFVGELEGRAIVLQQGGRYDADDQSHGVEEVWAGEPASGTAEPLAGFISPSSAKPTLVGAVQGRLLFHFDESSPLWTTDGTRAGTALLTPALYMTGTVAIGKLRVGGRLLVIDRERMAWATDGTPAGTEPLGIPFPQLSAGSDPLPTLGGRAYFVVGKRIVGSDGTAAGTTTLVDLHDGDLRGLLATADRLYFIRRTSHAQELWSSDGSPTGTRRVRRFGRAYGGTRIDLPMGLEHGVVFFECPLAGRWCHLVREGVTGSTGSSKLTHDRLVPGSVALHLGASGLVFADGDGQLWRTDGTTEGTVAFGRCAGPCQSSWGPLRPRARAGGRSLFSAPTADRAWPGQVWVTDGTDAGTRPLDADCARRRFCATRLAAVTGNAALLVLGSDVFPRFREVARLDVPAVRPVPALGTGPAMASGDGFLVAGDLLLARLASDGSVLASMPVPGSRNGAAEPRSLIALGERLVFTACDGERQRIYRTDGTPDAVVALADGASSCWSLRNPVPPVGLAGAVVVDARYEIVRIDETGSALTLLEGGAAAVVPVGDALALLVPSFECHSDSCLYGKWLSRVFVSPDGVTPASEVATLRISPFGDFVALGDRLLVSDWSTAEGVFAIRPTAPGAGGLEPIRCPAGGDVCPSGGELARLGDVPFLLGNGLWRIEGDAGTRIAPATFYNFSDLVAFDRALFFVAQPQGDANRWLYRSDGSASGIAALAPISGSYRQMAFQPLGLDGKLYFIGNTPELGEEVWVSDGTAAGTHPFLDLQVGAAGSRPLLLSVAAGRLFFSADDGEHGVELWSTDGVAAHTAMVADIAPGSLSSWPGRPVLAGDTLYFSADDGITGSELWAVPVVP